MGVWHCCTSHWAIGAVHDTEPSLSVSQDLAELRASAAVPS
jgi:hypothetical protein